MAGSIVSTEERWVKRSLVSILVIRRSSGIVPRHLGLVQVRHLRSAEDALEPVWMACIPARR